MKRLSLEEINWYASTGEGIGKAIGCTVNGIAGYFIKSISGSDSNIMGMPKCKIFCILCGFGLKLKLML